MINLIHIGDYKTGTSWWQHQGFPSHSDVCLLDGPNTHPEIVRLMHQLIDSRDLDFDANAIRDKFADILSQNNFENKIMVISREALSGVYPTGDHAKRVAERLYAVFGDTKILIMIREQFSMLKSLYSQYIKIGGSLCFSEFVYDPVVSAGLVEKLKYYKIIDAYVNLFGRENVFVGLFEEFKSDNELFAKRVFDFIGCSTDWSLTPYQTSVNPSLTKVGLEVQRFINRFLRNHFNPRMPLIPLDKLVVFFLNTEKKKEMLERARNRLIYSVQGYDDAHILKYAISFSMTLHVSKACEYIQVGPKLKVPNSITDDLRSEFAKSNNVLQDRHGLPVDKYGWSV